MDIKSLLTWGALVCSVVVLAYVVWLMRRGRSGAINQPQELGRPRSSPVSSPVGTRLLFWLSIGLYLAACCLPAITLPGLGPSPIPGVGGLIMGWFTMPFWWLANPLWFIGLRCLVRRTYSKASWFGIAAFVIAIAVPAMNKRLEIQLHLGYYLWLGSFVSLVAAALFAKITQFLSDAEELHSDAEEEVWRRRE